MKLPPAVARELTRTGHRTKKGPVFDTAIIAGVLAAKRTHELIPFCHPLPLSSVKIDIETSRGGLRDHLRRGGGAPHRRRDGSADRRQRRGADRSTTCARRCRTTSRSARCGCWPSAAASATSSAGSERKMTAPLLRPGAGRRPQHAHGPRQGRARIRAAARSWSARWRCCEPLVASRASSRCAPTRPTDPLRARYAQIVDRGDVGRPGCRHPRRPAAHPAGGLAGARLRPALPRRGNAAAPDRASRPDDDIATAFRSSHDGLPEPLCAIYEPAAAPALQQLPRRRAGTARASS